MKPIIVDMNDMSDSAEVYASKPNRFLVYTIYLIFAILLTAILWMSFSDMDIVVKSNGIFKGSNALYEISSGVTGSITEARVENGQYVEEGDVLYILSVEELSDTILNYQNELEAANDRIEILLAYEKSLSGDSSAFESLKDNPYYKEMKNRRDLLFASMDLSTTDTESKSALYKGNVDSLSDSIAQYQEKIDKWNKAKQCITLRNNTFSSGESEYYSTVSNYIASYDYTALTYQNKIDEYQKQIEAYDVKIAEEESKAASGETTTSSSETVETLKAERDALVAARDSVQTEMTKALTNLELQQISTIDQKIVSYEDARLSMDNSLNSARLQLDSVNNSDNGTRETVAILTEKGNIATEKLNCEDKVREYENYLKSFDIQNDNCYVKAGMSGYFYSTQDFRVGSHVPEGTTIGTIYPESQSKYYAQLYVENSDIASIKEGQEVKFEIAAYPSSEYGYFEGTVENIAKDISVDQSTGYAYYLVRVRCDNVSLTGKDGQEASLINGMACQGKIIVDEKKVMRYLLEKVDLVD